ncbi:MAG: SDR family oxidoreductase [Eubacteriales bacterium]|jgi:NAD(P)-dependent dehydrogenase (short-subunit alcohol dehydrogenase family)|nr:SDR family oxidoreductase [Clostridiales bacterium]
MYENFFKNKTVVITGGSHGIGRRICERFAAAGATIYSIDIAPPAEPLEGCVTFVGDIGEESALREFADLVLRERTQVSVIINNAPPIMRGLDSCTWDEFNYALRVGVAAPFMLVKLLSGHLAPGASIVNISSTRDSMSQPNTESYAAAKGGIHALTHALAVTLAGRARVNSISPGWINCSGAGYTGADLTQHPVKRIGTPDDIASLALYLCSDDAGFITGENIVVDGGMTKLMIYHSDNGWRYEG